MQKINGSGVMIFIECQNEIYVLLLSSTGRGGVFLTEPGGKLEPNLTAQQNAIKELFEETYASIKIHHLTTNVIVNNKYICYSILLKVQDFEEIKHIMDSNKKILTQQRNLYCFREMFGYDFINLKTILEKKTLIFKGQKIDLHKRTIGAIQELVKHEIIKDGLVNLQQSNFKIQQHHFNKDGDKLQILEKQLYIEIV